MGNFNRPQFLNHLTTVSVKKCELLAKKEATRQIQELKTKKLSRNFR